MKALIIGFGKSGRGAAQLLLKKGMEVIAVDRKVEEMVGVTVLPEEAEVGAVDLIVVSPGIPPHHPQLKGRKGIGEVELALRELSNRCIGITGTNGKTTLTYLVTHVLNSFGIKARALGNVGESLAAYACSPDPEEILVIELSSYQLETLETKAFDVGIITNITPDHLDRYESFEAYAETKRRLGKLIKEGGIFLSDSYLQQTKMERYWPFDDAAFNAWLICQHLGVSWNDFLKALETFKRPPHRMEFVKTIDGVHFINDSKGTTPESVLYGVGQIKGPILLIAGGRPKKTSFQGWKIPFQGKVRKIFTIGEAAPQIEEELKDIIPTLRCSFLCEAVKAAKREATPGDTVLLSPGCASFDQFQNYEERGEKFKEFVS